MRTFKLGDPTFSRLLLITQSRSAKPAGIFQKAQLAEFTIAVIEGDEKTLIQVESEVALTRAPGVEALIEVKRLIENAANQDLVKWLPEINALIQSEQNEPEKHSMTIFIAQELLANIRPESGEVKSNELTLFINNQGRWELKALENPASESWLPVCRCGHDAGFHDLAKPGKAVRGACEHRDCTCVEFHKY